MRLFDEKWLMAGVAKELRRRAFLGTWDGSHAANYLENCKGLHEPTGTVVIFSRDVGHHSSGWWKNPDYENCFHLSLSFRDPETLEPTPKNNAVTGDWLNLFYGDNKHLIWAEPPFDELGKKLEVWHYRLFMHPDWQTPLLPRGEVYSKANTPAGWKSWSDVQSDLQEARQCQ